MRALFQNPKAALAYVGVTLVGVVLFIGTENDPGTLKKTVDTFGGSQSQSDIAASRKFGESIALDDDLGADAKASVRASKPEEEAVVAFATDEELIDEASGFDPTPTQDFSGFNPNPDAERPPLSDQDKKKPEDKVGGWAGDND